MAHLVGLSDGLGYALLACSLSQKASRLEKQPVPTACFEEVFLDFLRLRFEAEPLPHYVMAAMHVCDETSRDYPPFVRSFMTWFAQSFLFDRNGTFPAQSHNADPADKRWRRYADCHALLEGWLNDDLIGPLEAQEERLELVERVALLRSQDREDAPGKAQRRRSKTTKTDAEVFDDLEEWFGERAHTLRRDYKKLAEPGEYMSATIPIALVRADGGYEVKTIEVDRQGAIRLSERKSRSTEQKT
jgi:predicted RNA-binding protein with RPS1 domain